MARRALVLAIAFTLSSAVAGCRAGKSDAQRQSTEKAAVPSASASTELALPTSPKPVSSKLDETDGEQGLNDLGNAGDLKGRAFPSASSSAGLQANHNPKGSEPERVGACPPGDPRCGLEHNPKGTEPEGRPTLPPPAFNTR